MIDKSLRIENQKEIQAGAARIWKALTDPKLIREYLFGTDTLADWQVGGHIVFQGEFQGKAYRDKGIIREFIPEKVLAYDYWSGFNGLEDLPENYSLVRFSILAGETHPVLKIEQTGFANEAARTHSQSSWTMVLESIARICERQEA